MFDNVNIVDFKYYLFTFSPIIMVTQLTDSLKQNTISVMDTNYHHSYSHALGQILILHHIKVFACNMSKTSKFSDR